MRPLLYLLATGFTVGLTTNLTKVAIQQAVNPLAFLAWPVLAASLLLGALASLGRRGDRERERDDARKRKPVSTAAIVEYSFVAGLLTIAAPQLMLFAAVPHVGAAFVVLSLAFPPLYTYLGALLLRMERFDTARAAGVLLALGGAAILAVFKLSEPRESAVWVALTLFAPVLLAAGNLYRTLRWPKNASPASLAPLMLGGAAVILIAFGLVSKTVPAVNASLTLAIPAEPGLGIAGLFVAQAFTFAAAYRLFFLLQRAGGPVYLSLLGSVAAITGVPIAVLLLGESLPRGLFAAGTLIVLGVGLLTARHAPRSR